jgi:hypothetical protein
MCIGEFPHLILEVISDTTNETDRRRMMLQVAYLVRLGNSLRKNTSSESIVVVAIYVNKHFEALRYLFYQPDVSQPQVG